MNRFAPPPLKKGALITLTLVCLSTSGWGQRFAPADESGRDPVGGNDPAPGAIGAPLDLSAWTWSGAEGTLQTDDKGLILFGGTQGEFLAADAMAQDASDWLFMRGSWLGENLAEDAIVLSWDDCALTLYPTEAGWVPALGDVVFHPRLAIGADEVFEAALRIDEAGLVDFSWNGELLLEQAPLGVLRDQPPLVTVPPGFVLGLEDLEWTPITIEEASALEISPSSALIEARPSESGVAFGVVLKPGESRTPPGVEVPPPSGPPPPHPYLAMDGEGRLLDTRGAARKGPGGSLHAGGALVGNGKASLTARNPLRN